MVFRWSAFLGLISGVVVPTFDLAYSDLASGWSAVIAAGCILALLVIAAVAGILNRRALRSMLGFFFGCILAPLIFVFGWFAVPPGTIAAIIAVIMGLVALPSQSVRKESRAGILSYLLLAAFLELVLSLFLAPTGLAGIIVNCVFNALIALGILFVGLRSRPRGAGSSL